MRWPSRRFLNRQAKSGKWIAAGFAGLDEDGVQGRFASHCRDRP